MKPSSKSEIHALQFRICELICRLNDLVCRQIKGWKIGTSFKVFTGDFSVHGTPDNPDTMSVCVFICPSAWPPECGISCQFNWDRAGGWKPAGGNVVIDHLKQLKGFAFRCRQVNGYLAISPGGTEGEFLSQTMEAIALAIEGRPILRV